MTPPATAITGQRGEEIAARYLENSGYRILERNVRFGRLEIDIVARDTTENMMVFVEVKTRSHSSSLYPVRTAVNGRKRRAMRLALEQWVQKHEYEGPGRIDIVCVAGGRISEHVVNIGSDFF